MGSHIDAGGAYIDQRGGHADPCCGRLQGAKVGAEKAQVVGKQLRACLKLQMDNTISVHFYLCQLAVTIAMPPQLFSRVG